MNTIDTTTWDRSSYDNWASPTHVSLQMLVNLDHDYIVSDVSFSNYSLTSSITVKDGDDDGIGVVFDYINSNNYKYVMYHGGGLSNWTPVYSPVDGIIPKVILVEVKEGIHTRLSHNLTFPAWTINSTFNIELSNVFNDIVFYVNGMEALRYEKEDVLIGKIGFVTHSQVADFDNIEIFEVLANRMQSNYVLYALENSDLLTEITVIREDQSDISTEIYVRAIDADEIGTEINIVYADNSDVNTEILATMFNNMETEIYIRPHNRMRAIYEVEQPPIVAEVFNPIKDSFTREQIEYQSINYGYANSMVVGKNTIDTWRSFVQFDFGEFNPSYIITDSYLRLHYRDAVPANVELELLSSDTVWQEYNITHLNRPIPINLITSEFNINQEDGYIEFSVTEIVNQWIDSSRENNGFILRVANESIFGQVSFYTRETHSPPELVINYYDSRIFSQGRSQLVTEIFVEHSKENDMPTDLNVKTDYGFNEVELDIYVHRVEDTIDHDNIVEIIVSKNKTLTELIIAKNAESSVNIEIAISNPLIDTVETHIAINRPKIDTEITVMLAKDSSKLTDITASKPKIDTEIIVRKIEADNISTEIDIKGIRNNDTLIDILVSKPKIDTEIEVVQKEKRDLYTDIAVSRLKLETEITVKYKSEINTEISVLNSSKIDTIISVTRESIETEIFVPFISAFETEIYVSNLSEIDTEIYVSHTSNIETEMDIQSVGKVQTEITVTRDKLHTEIMIPYYVNHDIETEIKSRVLRVSNIETTIIISGGNFAYAFII